jgi:hypothetical protein
MSSENKEKDILRLMKAIEDFYDHNTMNVFCDKCNTPILFERVNDILVHKCQCGKFSGSLR